MKTDNTIAQAHDEAYEFMTSLAVNKDFDTDLSLDEFYHKYYNQLTPEHHAQIEEILNKF
jgi:hypothetical protein